MERLYENENAPRAQMMAGEQVRLVNNDNQVRDGKKMSGRLPDIALSFSVVTIPMLLFTGFLLGLVYHYRITHSDVPFETLRVAGTTDEAGIYYVNVSATILIFIASWSSSLATILAGFIMALASYPIARRHLQDARAYRPQQLLTPFQLALTLRFLDGGGWGALWSWIKYVAGWRKQRQVQARTLTTSASVMIVAIFLGLMVFLADTWLHVTTKTVNFIQTAPVTVATDYSLTLRSPNCTSSNNSFGNSEYGCSLDPAATQTFLINSTQSLQVLNNISSIITVLNNGPDQRYTYLGVPSVASLFSRDYTATTFGMQTQCRPVSNECNLNAYDGASTPFRCSETFQGDLQLSNNWVSAYFPDASMSSNESVYGVGNPYLFGLAALVKNPGAAKIDAANLTAIPEIVAPVHGGVAFVLMCSTTLYDIEYDSVNQSITRFVATASNTSVANIWQGPMAFVDVGQPNLQTAVTVAASTATDAQDLADQIALAYSKVALGVGAQSVQRAPALAAQERTSLLVARVPMAALFSLVVSNLLFVLVGVALTIAALATSGGEVRDVQARLSIFGLVADTFEGLRASRGAEEMEELFEEHDGKGSMRIAIHRAATGGYAYKVWQKLTQERPGGPA